MLLNNIESTRKSKKKLKTTQKKNENTAYQNLWDAAKTVLRKVANLQPETRKIPNKQSHFTPKVSRKRRKNEAQSQ